MNKRSQPVSDQIAQAKIHATRLQEQHARTSAMILGALALLKADGIDVGSHLELLEMAADEVSEGVTLGRLCAILGELGGE